MRTFVILFLGVFALGLGALRAESGTDPGDLFVNAYMAVQQGEKAEQGGDLKGALNKLRSASAVLSDIATRFPTWQPSIVEYRRSRTAEGITRIQEKIARFGGGKTGADTATSPAEPLPLPQDGEKPLIFENPASTAAGETPEPATSRRGKAPAPRVHETDLFEKASQQMKKLQADLQAAKDEAARLQTEKSSLSRQLDDMAKAHEASDQKQQVLQKRADFAEQALLKAVADGKSDSEKIKALQADAAATKRALRNMSIEAEADTEYRKQLDDRYKFALSKIGQLTQQRDSANQTSESVPGKIASIQKQLDQVKKDKDDLAAKLQTAESQLTKVTSERDDALAKYSRLQEAQKQVDKLVSDNTTLSNKLAEAEKTISQFKLEGEDKDRQIAALKTEVTSVRGELAQARKESADYQRQMADLQTKLEKSGKELADAKAENAAGAAEKKKMVDENAILRGIVLRQQKEEAVRAKTRKVVLEQLADLDVHSKSLLKEIDFLSQPVVKLTAKERALFKKPELQVSESEIAIGGEEKPALPSPAPAPEPTVQPKAPPATPPLEANTAAPVPPVREPAPAPAPAPPAEPAPNAAPPSEPTVQTIPAPTPAPAKAKRGAKTNGSNVADNSRNGSATSPQKSKTIEPPPLPIADNAPLTATAPPTPPPAPTQTEIGPLASAKPSVNATSAAPPTTSAPPPSSPPAASEKPSAPVVGGSADTSKISSSPNLPDDLLPLARDAKDQFERGNYLDAEKLYRKILAKAPNNLYTLSNLGVVLFRAGKLKLAEETFRKAIAVAPEDGFSHCTLGIVYYSQGKYDDAVNELTKALAIDPKNATAHNYLGITASQKGWQEAAQKELETATTLDPQYADAHFNLAVVYATQTPPNKDNARKYYKRATELGAEPDSALEQLIK